MRDGGPSASLTDEKSVNVHLDFIILIFRSLQVDHIAACMNDIRSKAHKFTHLNEG